MADGFETMVTTARAFFTELRDNNTKDWFDPRKSHYKDAIAGPAAFFANLLAEDLARLTGQAHRPKVFRIYRDVRFSKDKTPLNTHLHLMWSRGDESGPKPVWFWGLSPDYFIMGMGRVGMQGPALTRYRAFVDRSGDRVQEALDAASGACGAEMSDWGPEPLKRVPKPYDADHPHADLLKRKSLAVSAPIPVDWEAQGLVKSTVAVAQGLLPLWRVIEEI